MTTKTQVIVTKPIKNLGVALILSALFGPLGMLYATIMGAIIMAVVYGLICLFTFGLGLTVIWLLNPICMIWSYIAVKNFNKNLLQESSEG